MKRLHFGLLTVCVGTAPEPELAFAAADESFHCFSNFWPATTTKPPPCA